MKKRLISALIALIIFIPVFLMGGFIYKASIYIISMLALKEFLDVKRTKKDVPAFIEFISYVIMSLLVLSNTNNEDLLFKLDFRVIVGLFLVFLLPTVLYHDREKFSINDAFYLIGGLFFLGVSFSLLIIFRNINLNIIIYLFMITIFTDTFAYLIGMLIGKNKLLQSISPKKTWEGMIAGTALGSFVATVFYITVINNNVSIILISIITIFLSVLGQYGDLVFSAIKRYYGKKDFSNIMPGHGGILDRLDSIIFVLFGFIYFITIL
ncbi:MAG: phosphatidate cytidylyltransferase [Bacilli bacterium]|nr:phosphatidate cytidylyltransferase [Bacilli bacterium]